MAVPSQKAQILVKSTKLPDRTRLRLDGRSMAFTAQPLFRSVDAAAQGMAAAPHWQILTPGPQEPDVNPWDLCHGLVGGRFRIAGGGDVLFAEPDLAQPWTAKQATPPAEASPQNEAFPTDPDPLWHLDPTHSDLASALAGLPGTGQRLVRIAHLDTGYDPGHVTRPVHLKTEQQKNFVDDGQGEDDATDRIDLALSLKNPGHGTGTLGLLAGNAAPTSGVIGAAPFAEIVPIRVANSVVLFRNSAIARALDYVHQLCRDPTTRIDVVTMSMGGVPSQAWADAINALYDEGVVVVTAAGNNFGNLPTRQIVWPARFRRVIAACGVMADGSAYADLPVNLMAGNYGPDSKMDTAIAAYTPNTPWARRGSRTIVDLDGAGTSSATPQVAAAAALVIQARQADLDKSYPGWKRVEAVRSCLFTTAEQKDKRPHFGQGVLRAAKAVAQSLPLANALGRQEEDDVSFPILRLLLPDGLAATGTPALAMLELEALQLSQTFPMEALVPDCDRPDASLTPQQASRLAEALATQPGTSRTLRDALSARVPSHPSEDEPPQGSEMTRLHLAHAIAPPIMPPGRRRLRVFAYDPLLSTQLENLQINRATLDIPWEADLQPGPVGEYLEVVDVDPSSRCCYAPINLNHPNLLSCDGLAPSEGNPQFHQQMVYAVAMKTIERFEIALGRPTQWSSHLPDGKYPEQFVRRLRIHPHGLRERNAYYSPERKALLFGYFRADADGVGDTMPGGLIFSCLSHDIVAHETTHALLDGLHPRFSEATNPDVLAFHEGFADIVALFQHFTMPEALRHQISLIRGDLGQQNLLADLAREFGEATGRHGALRSALARPPKLTDYASAEEAHDRGAVLVAAVFAAFRRIYERRAAELMRLASGGTGIMPAGALPEILIDELARTAAKVADQVLTICIRALDYCPPVDITFGDYLRALITADRDVVPDDTRLYRVAFISAFRERGIIPTGVPSLSPESLTWEPPPRHMLTDLATVMKRMSGRWNPNANREDNWKASKANAKAFHSWLLNTKSVSKEEFDVLGLVRTKERQPNWQLKDMTGELGRIEIHSVRPARRITQDGSVFQDLVIEITQTWRHDHSPLVVRGGCTLLIDRQTSQVRYLIRKRLDNLQRIDQQLTMAAAEDERSYVDSRRRVDEPFAILHKVH